MKRRILAALAALAILSLSLASGFYSDSNHYASHSAYAGTTAASQKLYQINVVEKGLPAGTYWSVGIFEAPPNQTFPVGPGENSWNSTVTFYEPPGTYTFTAFADGPFMQKNFYVYGTVMNSSITVYIPFIELFNISLTEHGLPPGFNWGFNAVSTTNASNNGGVSGPPFRETQSMLFPNGTYSVTAGMVLDTSMSNQQYFASVGEVTLNGSSVNFSAHFYPVNVTAENLPSNVSWGFPFQGGPLFPGNQKIMHLFFLNGTFTIQPLALGYYTGNLTFSVSGTGRNLTAGFEKEFPVTFNEHGLPSVFAGWSVSGFTRTYGGVPSNLSSKSQTYMITNGSYRITVEPQGIYQCYINGTLYVVDVTAKVSISQLTVSGNPESVNVTFNATYTAIPSKNPFPPSSHGTNFIEYLYGGIAVSSGLAAAVVGIYLYRRKKG